MGPRPSSAAPKISDIPRSDHDQAALNRSDRRCARSILQSGPGPLRTSVSTGGPTASRQKHPTGGALMSKGPKLADDKGAPRKCLTPAVHAVLDQIEARFGPVQVISTCRPGARIAGSGRISRHASGNAVDFEAGKRKGAIIDWLVANHKKGGTMTYPSMSHIHVDVGQHFVSLAGGRKYASHSRQQQPSLCGRFLALRRRILARFLRRLALERPVAPLHARGFLRTWRLVRRSRHRPLHGRLRHDIPLSQKVPSRGAPPCEGYATRCQATSAWHLFLSVALHRRHGSGCRFASP